MPVIDSANDSAETTRENRQKACETYVDQTKLLVTLASGFLFGPAAAAGLLKDASKIALSSSDLWLFLLSELSFILSVLFGYLVMASVTGSMDDGSFDVFRQATRVLSILQFFAYVVGLFLFVGLVAWLLI